MNVFWDELTFGLPEFQQLARIIIRLTAALLGAIIGYQRERRANLPDCERIF